MDKSLTELCGELNNYFWRAKIQGKFVIRGGSLVPSNATDNLQDGQYFRIVGSVFNDGVHKYPASDLTDEEFDGAIWSMAVPQAVIDLASEIQAWQAKYGGAESPAMSPFTAESFNNYSYSKGSGGTSGTVDPNSWQAVFGSRMNRFRRLRGCP